MMIGQAEPFSVALGWGRLSGLLHGRISGLMPISGPISGPIPGPISGPIPGPTQGRAEDIPVLALHGWLDNAASFLPLMALSERRWLALELAGHGHSDHRGAGNFGPFWDHVADLLETLDQLQLTRVDLLGHSMGGAVAVVFAAAFPERVRSLVLLESLGPLTHSEERFVSEIRRATLERLAFKDRRRFYPSLELPIAARAQRKDIDPASAELLMRRGCEELEPGVRFRTDPRHLLPSATRGTEGQMLTAIRALQCPTLAVLATPRTSYLDGPAMAARRAAWPQFNEVLVPGGHHVHMDSPALVLPELAGFWQRIALAKPAEHVLRERTPG